MNNFFLKKSLDCYIEKRYNDEFKKLLKISQLFQSILINDILIIEESLIYSDHTYNVAYFDIIYWIYL